MEMVDMGRIVVRTEHGREQAAGSVLHLGKEAALRRIASPVLQYTDRLAIVEIKSGNVDGIASLVPAAAASLLMVYIAAGIGAVMPDAAHRRPEMFFRRWQHHMTLPDEKRCHGRTGELDAAAIGNAGSFEMQPFLHPATGRR